MDGSVGTNGTAVVVVHGPDRAEIIVGEHRIQFNPTAVYAQLPKYFTVLDIMGRLYKMGVTDDPETLLKAANAFPTLFSRLFGCKIIRRRGTRTLLRKTTNTVKRRVKGVILNGRLRKTVEGGKLPPALPPAYTAPSDSELLRHAYHIVCLLKGEKPKKIPLTKMKEEVMNFARKVIRFASQTS